MQITIQKTRDNKILMSVAIAKADYITSSFNLSKEEAKNAADEIYKLLEED